MQCSNCQFENMPGILVCGRCGASLQLAASAIDVHPPRASRAAKRWRRWFPVVRHWHRLRNARVFSGIRISGWPADLQRPGVLFRMIVPGWAQHHLGRKFLARCLLGGYAAALAAGLLWIGTIPGSLLLGLAIAIHVASVADVVAASVTSIRRRLIYSLAALFLLIAAVYYPAGRLLTRVATPQRFALPAPPFAAGDVVLINPSAYRRSAPQPGDVVQYRLPTAQQVQDRVNHRVYRLQGDRIDRILARAGDRVTCDGRQLVVNGQPSPWLPLNPQALLPPLDVTVPEDSYLILPSTDPLAATVLNLVSIVPRERIWGRVYWRNQPLWRFGPIR